MTQSISETTGLPSPSDTSEQTTRAAPPAPPAPLALSAATEALDAQLLDTSASVSVPLPASHASELASSMSDTPELSTDKSEDGQFLSQGTSDAGALVSRPPFDADLDHSSVSITESPSTSRARSLSPVSAQKSSLPPSISFSSAPADDRAARLPSSPPARSNPPPSWVPATTPLHPPAPGRMSFAAAPMHASSTSNSDLGRLRSSTRTTTPSLDLSGVSTHADISHGPPVPLSSLRASRASVQEEEISTNPLLAAPEPDASAPGAQAHVDPHRLVLYQHKVNERLTQENEMLKSQCEALMQVIERHNMPLDERDASTPGAPASTEVLALQSRIASLEATVAEQRAQLDQQANTTAEPLEPSVLSRTTDTLQTQHEQLLSRVKKALVRGDEAALASLVEPLRAALNQAHGVINSMRELVKEPYATTPSSRCRASTASEPSWRHSTPSRGQVMDALRQSVASLSMDGGSRIATDMEALQQTVRTLTAELHSARAQLDTALSKTTDANASKLRIEARLATTAEELAQARSHLADRSAQLHGLREQRGDTTATRAELQRLERELVHARDQVTAAEAQHEQTQQQQVLLEEQLRLADERAHRAMQDAEAARRAQSACEAHIDEQLSQLASLRNVLADQETELGQLRGDKDHLWMERRQIMEQLGVFEQHLREVRSETDQYGSDLRKLQQEKQAMLAEAAQFRERESQMGDRIREQVALALRDLAPRLRALEDEAFRSEEHRRALAFQKLYLARTLHHQEWLFERLRAELSALAPVLHPYGGVTEAPRRVRRWRVVLRAVQFAVRVQLFHPLYVK
ncbi:hypothetical protein MEQU1_001418 [Malassezia equina]|uniref:Pericentrin/AKAP-450 centrosomal targeting domain-containing protein n=1 Tax=Malassezia equina TaxID=1381935 RepID=A0AAF0EHD6_9BASI|nr:hypothetical protein MEQU1_001418 [Malassezia equina]